MFKILPAFLLLSAAALAQPSQPTFLQVGTLSCAARMYTPIQLQIWCFKDPSLKIIQVNIIVDVSDCGFQFTVNDSNDVATGTLLHWNFLPNVIPDPIVVSWEAIITKFGVTGPTLKGVL
jgi:hypothetical protein